MASNDERCLWLTASSSNEAVQQRSGERIHQMTFVGLALFVEYRRGLVEGLSSS